MADIQTVVQDGITVNTQVADVPQIQTTITEDHIALTSIINAPFVEVTSVNGQTGDVFITIQAGQFEANKQYPEGGVNCPQWKTLRCKPSVYVRRNLQSC